MPALTTVKDLTGQTFGRLTVLRREPRPSTRAFWLCHCECGRTTVKMGKYLLCGDTRSCGCAQVECRAGGNPKHGGATGGHLTVEYISWRSAKERCYNPRQRVYRHYGGRGIRMCDRWLRDFGAFLADMGPRPARHSLDRWPDMNGDYEPGNCRWATQKQQVANRRCLVKPPSQ
jgi:hypothetical protein